jgi:hypothetical protein
MNKLDELIAYADRYGERPEPEPIEMTKQERLDKIKFLRNKLGLTKSKTKKSKEYKESNIMKGRSDLKKKSNGKYEVETELNIKEGLEPKVKIAFVKSIIEELNKNFNDYEFFYQKKN